MKKFYSYFVWTLGGLLFSQNLTAQLIGGSAYMKGDYVEVAIGPKGNEGTAEIPGDTTYHFRGGSPGLSPWGFCANPQMDGWDEYNGDFFTPGTPECGFGLTYTIGATTINRGNNFDIFQIPGEITDFTETVDSVSVIWTGMVDSLQVTLLYELKKTELKYTTTVTLNNLGSNTFTDVYFYDNVDPDNNQSINFNYSTLNEIFSQSGMADDSVIVRASQETPWLSEVYYAAYGADWKGASGGFSNRDGAQIWNGVGYSITTEGYNNYGDEAIALAHKTVSIGPGRSSATEFSYITAFTREAIGADAGLGVQNPDNVDFKVYPNPTQGNDITIQMDGAFNYTIMDASGRIVVASNGNNIEIISVQSLEKGIYFVQVEQDGATSTERLILK